MDEAGQLGSSWSVQTLPRTADVYVMHRASARWIKSSFHQSDQWHYVVTERGIASLECGESRYLAVSHSRPDLGEGWARAHRVTVARTELRIDAVERSEPKDVVSVKTVDGFPAIIVDILLGKPTAEPIVVAEDRVVDWMLRGDGGYVLILAFPVQLDADPRIAYAPEITQMRKELRESFGWDGRTPTRVVLFGVDPDEGFHRNVEIAVDPDPAH